MRDDQIRETMRRAAQGEPGVGDPWSRFERHARRAALARGGVVTALAAGAIVALALTLPGLNSGDRSFVAPGATGGVRPWTRYVDDVAGFELRYPPDWWKVYANPGLNAELAPQGIRPGVGHGDGELAFESVSGFTFDVTMGVESGTAGCTRYAARYGMTADAVNCSGIATRTDAAPLQKAGASVSTREVEVGDRAAERIDVNYPQEPLRPKGGFREIGLTSWCGGCRETTFVIDWWEGWTLQVRIIAPSVELFDQSARAAMQIVDTIARAAPPPATVASP